MASKAAGRFLGVAPQAKLIAVKCWDYAVEALVSDMVGGITYITLGALSSKKPSVANFAWHCSSTNSLVQAASHAILAGVHIVAAAGNSRMEALYFPSQSERFCLDRANFQG
jgi:cerevisin